MEHRRFDLGDVELEALVGGPANGPLVILLHGFPETADCWRDLAEHLGTLGYRVIAPNQRGYGNSSKPAGVAAYDLDRLADDVVRLVEASGHDRYALVGHDWGAAVGWWLASTRPEGLRSFCALSALHPALWREAMADDPDQRRKSRYVKFFALPWIPEWLFRLSAYRPLDAALNDAQASDVERAACRAAWKQPGTLTAMLNWYRAVLARRFDQSSAYAVTVPTALVYGLGDPFLSADAAGRCAGLGPAVRIASLPDVGHWVNHLPVDRLMVHISASLPPPR